MKAITKSDVNAAFATKIKEARKEQRWSQAEFGQRLAAAVGRHLPFSQAVISDFERGKMEIPRELLGVLPQVFGQGSARFSFSNGINHQKLEDFADFALSPDLWKQANELPAPFPQLPPLSEEELEDGRSVYFTPEQARCTNEILDRSGGLVPVFVRMARGHGCSTLAHFIHCWHRGRSLIWQHIPVLIELDELRRNGLLANPRQVVGATLRRAILTALARIDWHPLLPDASRNESAGGSRRAEFRRFHETHNRLREVLERNRYAPSSDIAAIWRPLGAEPADLLGAIYELSQGYIRSIRMVVDLSSSAAYTDPVAYDQAVGALQLSLQEISGVNRQPSGLFVAAAYFGHRQSFDAFEYGWNQPWVDVEFPWYRPLDVFGMLAYRYEDTIEKEGATPDLSERVNLGLPSHVPVGEPDDRVEILSSKIHPDLMTGIVAPDIPIVESTRLLASRMARPMARRSLVPA
jgi:transcriptional regulator with XRE-family HTH domain